MDSIWTDRNPSPTHHGLAPTARKWPVGVVLLIALTLMLVVPLASRAFGAGGTATYPGCAIAPWTGTCACAMSRHGTAMAYEDFAWAVRRPGGAPSGASAETILASARQACRIDHPVTRSAAQERHQ